MQGYAKHAVFELFKGMAGALERVPLVGGRSNSNSKYFQKKKEDKKNPAEVSLRRPCSPPH
jgi:hypothetical protein